ncbi:unnamed protein product [Rotaria magnacalcarata]
MENYATINHSRRVNKRDILRRFFNWFLVISNYLMTWKGLMIWNNTDRPVVVLLSDNIEPGFLRRGDLLFLTNYSQDSIHAGDLVMVNTESHDEYEVRRVMRIHGKSDGYIKFLAKFDGGQSDDGRELYTLRQVWLGRKDVVGKVKGYLPYIGFPIIWMQKYYLQICLAFVIFAQFAEKRPETR